MTDREHKRTVLSTIHICPGFRLELLGDNGEYQGCWSAVSPRRRGYFTSLESAVASLLPRLVGKYLPLRGGLSAVLVALKRAEERLLEAVRAIPQLRPGTPQDDPEKGTS